MNEAINEVYKKYSEKGEDDNPLKAVDNLIGGLADKV